MHQWEKSWIGYSRVHWTPGRSSDEFYSDMEKLEHCTKKSKGWGSDAKSLVI